jgi:alkylhydroperoxidase family enzyme
MPVIEPVPWEHLDSELQQMILRGREAGFLSTPVPNQVLAYCPDISKEQLRRHAQGYAHMGLTPRLRELLRLRIAAFNDCRACKAARKSDQVTEEDVTCLASDSPRFTPAEQAALKFAELFASDHMAIDDALFVELARHFSKAEIVEIGFSCANSLGGGRLMHVLRAWGDDEAPPALRYEGEQDPARRASAAQPSAA